MVDSVLPVSLAANPILGRWLTIGRDGVVEARSGKVELGQGVLTALAQIVAEELDVSFARVRMTAASTDISPDEGYTAGSLSVQHSGDALRLVSAETRAIYLGVAASRWSLAVSSLRVDDGSIVAPDGRSTTYWKLADDTLLEQSASGRVAPKRVGEYRVVGVDIGRTDLPGILTSGHTFLHDHVFEGMLFARVVRPPSRSAELADVSTASTLALPGVTSVLRDGSFLGVIGEREESVVRAVEVLRRNASWQERPTLPDEDDLPAFLTTTQNSVSVLFDDTSAKSIPDSALTTHTARFFRPYTAHASIGTSAAIAIASQPGTSGKGSDLHVWTHSQGIHGLRRELARAFDLSVDRVVVSHAVGAGCYGHNGADDAAMDAAIFAMATPGRAVQVVWSRPDELGWSPYGPAAVVETTAETAENGSIVAWEQEIWGGTHLSRPGSVNAIGLLGASHRIDGTSIDPGPEIALDMGGGAARNAVPGYNFGTRVINHHLTEMPLRTSSLRALGGFVNVFAIESFMNDLADASGRDPVEYRLDHLSDPRARAVIESVVARSEWRGWEPSDYSGHGIAYARYKNTGAYCAIVAEVEAINDVQVRKLTIAVDAGLIVNPDGARNQIEGGAVQATSWALHEQVRFNRSAVTSDTWETYPILRFSEVPIVDVELMPHMGNPSLGVGETAQGPTAAAIGNALADALGFRVRTLPFNQHNIVEAMPD